MIQKGIVTELNLDRNKITVRVPIFENAGDPPALFECAICNEPGIINGYSVDDIVYVDFENNYLNYPILMGKLYRGLSEASNNNTSIIAQTLSVSGPTRLSSDFKVGDISYSDLYYIKTINKNMQGMFDGLTLKNFNLIIDDIYVYSYKEFSKPERIEENDPLKIVPNYGVIVDILDNRMGFLVKGEEEAEIKWSDGSSDTVLRYDEIDVVIEND